MSWPAWGISNVWYESADSFIKMIADCPGFWCSDSDLKYLNIRLDTRVNRFKLYIDSKVDGGPRIEIHPDRVISAINSWRTK